MSPAVHTTDPDRTVTNRCLACDAMVSAQFARVFGDNQNDVHGCPRCQTSRELLG